jgi:hypothetical protein
VSSSFAHSAYAVTKKVKQNHGTNLGVPLSSNTMKHMTTTILD